MLHALRVAWTFFKIGLLNEFAYRANLYLQMLQSAVAVGAAIGGLLVVFGHTESLGGWGQDEVLAVLGVYLLMSAAMGGVIEPGMAALMEDVRLGTLDYTLTKPVDAQFLTSIADIRVWKLVDVALGVVVLAVALARHGSEIGFADAAGFLLMLLAGAAIIYSFFLVMASVSFWFLRIENIFAIFGDVYQAARWPIGIYPQWLRFILTFIVPVAIAVTVPAEAAVGRLTGARVLLALGVAAFTLVASRLLWRLGLKRYSGASA
jgi:ABC-2 type transport system permease protein